MSLAVVNFKSVLKLAEEAARVSVCVRTFALIEEKCLAPLKLANN